MAGALKPDRRGMIWDTSSLRDPHGQPEKAARVAAMFDAIAPTYQLVNALASLGRDAVWRRRAVVAAAARPTDTVVDVCCGTGDMLRAFGRLRPPPRRIVGVDFAAGMLERAVWGHIPAEFLLMRADALRLPLADATADVISCAFGARNFRDVQAGLREMYRIARPGARLVILEFAMPANRVLRWLYGGYIAHVLPLIAALISREKVGAYRYLASSIRTFEPTATMVRRLTDAGFADVRVRRMNLGGVALYQATRPNDARPRRSSKGEVECPR